MGSVTLSLSDGGEAPVVVADAPAPVGLPSEHNQCRKMLDPPAVQQARELAAKLGELPLG